MSIVSSAGYGQCYAYGETGGGGASYRTSIGVDEAIAAAMNSCENFTQACAYELRAQNDASAQAAQRLRKCSDAKAAVEEILGYFPVPTAKEPTNPKLNELPGIMEKRRSENDLPVSERFDLDKVGKALDALNKLLPVLGFPAQNWTATKSGLDALKTRLTGAQDEISAGNSRITNKQGLLIGYVNNGQTTSQGLVKTKNSMGAGWARVVGAS
jgi:hypothetical protein